MCIELCLFHHIDFENKGCLAFALVHIYDCK